MRTLTLGRTFSALLFSTAILACSGSPSGPSAPSVAGVWTGTWGSTSIRMNLDQSGSSVTGELTVGSGTHALTGEVDEAGSFTWATAPEQGSCVTFSSDDFQLQDGADAMSGRMFRASQVAPCGSTGRVQVTQADASVTRAF